MTVRSIWILTLAGGLALAGLASARQAAPAPADRQKIAELVGQANDAYTRKDFPKSAELYEAAVAAGAQAPDVLYNAGCAQALVGRKDAAFRHLEAAVAAGFGDEKGLQADPDLASLHADPRWDPLVGRVRGAGEARLAKIGNRALREEILKMKEVDQLERQKIVGLAQPIDPALVREVEAVDVRDTTRMKEIIAAHGWPGKSLVGEDGAAAAWLLVQHADKDPEFQQRCLPLLAEAVKKGEASGQNLAYLTDRVLVAQKKPQRYGTQARQVDGKLVPSPIEDEAHVDQRRAEVGLGSLADYMKQMEQVYAPKPAAQPPVPPAP